METAHDAQAGLYFRASGKPVQIGASETGCVDDDRNIVAGRWA